MVTVVSNLRYSPTLLVIREMCNEHLTKKQQEPKVLSYTSNDEVMQKAFQEGKDIYATIAGIAYNMPYESCLEHHPVTGEYQPDGDKRRSEAKTIVLGISYGRSVTTIAEQLFGDNEQMTDKEKVTAAQKIYDSVLNAFPKMRKLMIDSQAFAKKYGYVETFLGRRRHIPDMALPQYEFRAMPGYVNPDVNPLDVNTLNTTSEIPDRIYKQLEKEFSRFKYRGQVFNKTKELAEQHIKVINNSSKIEEAKRKCVNCLGYNIKLVTNNGSKSVDDICIGDKIVSLNFHTKELEADQVINIFKYDNASVVQINHKFLNCICTLNHRWVIKDFGGNYDFATTQFLRRASGLKSSCIKIVTVDKRLKLKLIDVHELEFIDMPDQPVWCIETKNGNFIAETEKGFSFLTGNSRIQGGAADLTKMAILRLENNKEWQKIGGKLINCIHDELLVEVPIDNIEKGKEILSDAMCSAADFMPFDITCDVTTTLRWYGLEYPCPFQKPESLNYNDEETVKWLQYMIVENEYILPIQLDKDGKKPKGMAGRGVNGIDSEELHQSIEDWIKTNYVNPDYVIDALEQYTIEGRLDVKYLIGNEQER